MGEVEPPLRAATPKRKRDYPSLDGSPRLISCRGTPTAASSAHPILPPATIANSHTSFSFEVPAYEGDDGSSSPRTRVARKFQGLALDSGGGAPGAKAPLLAATAGTPTAAETQPATVPRTHYAGSPTPRRVATVAMMHDSGTHGDDEDDGDDDDNGDGYFSARKRFKAPQQAESDSPPLHSTSVFAPVSNTSMGEWAARLQAAGALGDPAKSHSGSAAATTAVGSSGGTYNKTHHRNYKTVGLSPRAATPPLVGAKTMATGEAHEAAGEDDGSPSSSSLSPSPSHKEIVDPVRAALTWHEDEITVYDPDDEDDDGTGINGIGFKPTPAIAYARTLRRRQQLAEYRKREEREARARRSLRRRASPAVSGSGAGPTEGTGGAGVAGAGGSGGGSGFVKSAEQQRQAARRQQLAARRVRFLDVEPAAVITMS
ncbi:hypothetical protein RB600_006728 [Gaeumannomyces tritici]